jgi:FtsZ-binding cell division protein ZapB
MNKVMNIGALVMDERLQSRTEINEDTVSDYAEAILGGADFPPVLVYFDGISYYLTDGYHRLLAHKRAEKVSILCSVVQGTLRDAVFHSTGVNTDHGMRRTYADKRKAVMTLLDDFEWEGMGNGQIAKHCHVSPTFVSDLRKGVGKDTGDTVKYTSPSGKLMEKKKAPGRAPKEPELKGPEIKPEQPAQDDQNQEAIDMLLAENEELKARVAVVAMDGTPEEKQAATELINELREELRITKIELAAVKQSRDQYQSENSQLKSQCAAYQRQLKKLQG